MSARGVAGDVKLRRVTVVTQNVTVDPGDRRARLPNDVRDRDIRTEIIFQKRNARPALGECWYEITVIVFATAAPVTAVDINKNRTRRLTGGIYVQHLPGRATVRHIEPRFMCRSDFSTLVGSFSG